LKIIINFASKLGVDTVSRLIGFLTLPLITRALGPDGYGQFTYLFIILSYFGFFIDFGYLNYGTNKLCEKDSTENVIGKIISLQLITAAISYIVLVIVAPFFLDQDKYILLLIFSLTFITQIFSIKYYYLSKNKLYYNSLSEFAGQALYALLVFTLFITKPEVMTLVIISVVQSLVTAVFLILPYIKKEGIKLDFNIRNNLKTLKEAYKLGLATKAEAITATFIILCLGFFVNEESVGIYNASYKIYLIMLTVVQGLSFALMPKLLRNVKDQSKNNVSKLSFIFYIFLTLGLVLSLSMYLFADNIILLMFGSKFIESVFVLKCFSLTIFLMPLWMFFGLVILAFNKYNYLLAISVSSTVFSVLLSVILINIFGVMGSGFVLPLVSFLTIFVCIYFITKISKYENFLLWQIFSINSAYIELKNIFKK